MRDGGELSWWREVVQVELVVRDDGSLSWWCEVVEASAGGERWCRLVMVVGGVGV